MTTKQYTEAVSKMPVNDRPTTKFASLLVATETKTGTYAALPTRTYKSV